MQCFQTLGVQECRGGNNCIKARVSSLTSIKKAPTGRKSIKCSRIRGRRYWESNKFSNSVLDFLHIPRALAGGQQFVQGLFEDVPLSLSIFLFQAIVSELHAPVFPQGVLCQRGVQEYVQTGVIQLCKFSDRGNKVKRGKVFRKQCPSSTFILKVSESRLRLLGERIVVC